MRTAIFVGLYLVAIKGDVSREIPFGIYSLAMMLNIMDLVYMFFIDGKRRIISPDGKSNP